MRHLHVTSPDAVRKEAVATRLRPHVHSIETYSSLVDLRRVLDTMDKGTQHHVIYVPPPAQLSTFSQDLISLREIAARGVPASIICMSTEEALTQSAKALQISVILYDAPEDLPSQLRAVNESFKGSRSKTFAKKKSLTPREQSVLIGLRAGMPLKEIAANLGISPNTASTYKTRLMEKLGYETNAALHHDES
jgi:DNA-binding NarL/FixJ family response regulator